MKQIKKLKIVLLGLIIAGVSGCFPDNRTIYDGPLQVEFRPVSATMNLANATNYSPNVQLIGPHQDSAITVLFEIDVEQSTAVRGVHFDISGNSAQIPPNSSFAAIEVTANPEFFDGSSRRVVITLLGDDTGEVRAAQNYKTFTLTIAP
jgi:hypothetical protein